MALPAKASRAALQQRPRAISSRARVVMRAAAPVAPAPPKAPPLYLLQWHRSAGGDGDLVKQLKALEKVSKDAVWFSVKESEDGGAQHVLVVTDNAKAAKKYQLQEITQQDAPLAVALDGLPDPVQVPVPAIRAALLQRMMMDEDSSDSSDSDEEDCPTTRMTSKGTKATINKAELPQTVVEENPLAAQQAAALLGGATAAGPEGGDGAAAEVVLGLVAKEQRRKLKDAVRDVEKGVHGDGQPVPLPTPMMGAEGDSSTSSSSSSSSESESDEEEMATAMEGKKGKKEERKKDEKKDKKDKKTELVTA